MDDDGWPTKTHLNVLADYIALLKEKISAVKTEIAVVKDDISAFDTKCRDLLATSVTN